MAKKTEQPAGSAAPRGTGTTVARLRTHYTTNVIPALTKEFGYSNVMAVPKVQKVSVNIGLGEATKVDSVEITWPGGAIQKIAPPSLDRLTGITEK